MNLVITTGSLSRNAGGLFTSVRKLSQNVTKLGCNTEVFGLNDEYTEGDARAWRPITPVVCNRGRIPFFSAAKAMNRAVTARNPDIIHCHGIWMPSSIVDLQFSSSRGTPYVVSPRGMLDPWALNHSGWKKALAGYLFENRHLKHATCLHALCKSEADSMRAYGLTNPIAIIPNGIDLPDRPVAESTTARKKTLLFLGRIHPKKGLTELLEAWGMVQAETPDTMCERELIIAGWDDGDHENSLKAKATKLGLDASVRFVGPKFSDEKDDLLRSVDAFILPSFSEGFPMSVLEAWAYRLPVLMTPACNIPEGFTTKSAISLNPDRQSIANTLRILISMDESELNQMGSNGQNLIKDKFTWNTIAESMINVYNWCINGADKPDCVTSY